MDAIGYSSLSDDHRADDGFGLAVQEDEIRRTVDARGWHLVEIVRDANVGGLDTLPSRLGLASALASLRDRKAGALVVARIDRIASDLILQELICADARRTGAQIRSAVDAEDAEITDPVPGSERAIMRRAIEAVPKHESALRDLWVRYRLMRSPVSGDREQAALSRIEQLSEQGVTLEEISRVLSGEGFSPHFSRIWNRVGLHHIVERFRARKVEES